MLGGAPSQQCEYPRGLGHSCVHCTTRTRPLTLTTSISRLSLLFCSAAALNASWPLLTPLGFRPQIIVVLSHKLLLWSVDATTERVISLRTRI